MHANPFIMSQKVSCYIWKGNAYPFEDKQNSVSTIIFSTWYFFSHFMTVARENILPLFNDVFSAMSIAITDADQNVRTATELLVKLSMVSHTKKWKYS